MRTRIYVEGAYQWSANEPANGTAGPGWFRGGLVQGDPGWVEKARRHRSAEDQLAARRAAYKPKPKPKATGRPRLSPDVEPVRRGRGNPYPTDEERLAARRQSWRDAAAKKQAAARARLRDELQAVRSVREEGAA